MESFTTIESIAKEEDDIRNRDIAVMDLTMIFEENFGFGKQCNAVSATYCALLG